MAQVWTENGEGESSSKVLPVLSVNLFSGPCIRLVFEATNTWMLSSATDAVTHLYS